MGVPPQPVKPSARAYVCALRLWLGCRPKPFSAPHIKKLSVGYACASLERFLLVLFFAPLPAWARGGSGLGCRLVRVQVPAWAQIMADSGVSLLAGRGLSVPSLKCRYWPFCGL